MSGTPATPWACWASPARTEKYAALTLFGMALFVFAGAGFASRANSTGRPGAALCAIIAFPSPH
ncbi:hypothetical protein [Streptomyces mirabilis]|uniref:hypothetical protein n=1 Tax=Streptomyces mirabilis TaxID=68239 RepID=UPI00369AC778